jgi:hypothetical protein
MDPGAKNCKGVYMGILNVVFIIVILIAFGVAGTAMGRKRLEKLAESNRAFLEKYPDAARVYPYSRASITSEAVRIHTVNGELPEFFYDAEKINGIGAIIGSVIAAISGSGSPAGFYLAPGTSTVEMSYYHNRPGIMYKNVISSVEAIKKELTVEANKGYTLGFDRKEEIFTLKENN